MERFLNPACPQFAEPLLLPAARWWPRCLAVALLMLLASPLPAAQVRVRNGTLVRLELRYDVTTENAAPGDLVEFDIPLDVLVDDRVVIAKGSVAWGQVTEVKGAGKPKAKDAMVAFRFMTVRTVDNQQIPLRLLPMKPKRYDSKDSEVVISTPMPGLRERMIGISKGREFAAYTDVDALVNVPDEQPAANASPGGAAPGMPSSGAAPATGPTAPAPSVTALLPPEDAYVDINSDPRGAEIVIDGAFRGSTPSRLQVPEGRYEVEIRLKGHRPWVRNMVVNAGSKPSIRAVLERE